MPPVFAISCWGWQTNTTHSRRCTDSTPYGSQTGSNGGVKLEASIEEKNKVLFESLQTGRDYAERPEFYIPYNAETAGKVLARSRGASALLKAHPHHRQWLENYARAQHHALSDVRYLPVMAREDWVAIVTPQGQIAQFLKGDGFL